MQKQHFRALYPTPKGVGFTARFDKGNNALHNAIAKNNPDIVTLLLKYKPDFTITDKDGKTPLVLATEKNNPQIIDLLTKTATAKKNNEDSLQDSVVIAETKDTSQPDTEKYQELRKKLQEYLKSEETKKLFNTDEVNLQDQALEIHSNILEAAVANFDSTDILEYLHAKGINFTAVINQYKLNILMSAASLGKKAMVGWLLDSRHKKTLIEAKDREGFTSLNHAILSDNPDHDIVKLLLEAGADINATNKNGNNALKLAKDKLENISKNSPKDEHRINNRRSIIELLENNKTENQE